MNNHHPLDQLTTEQSHPDSSHIDTCSPEEIVALMNREDRRVCDAVGKAANEIAQVILWVTEAIRDGGRLIYIGAGTSGRLGVLDASECPPTFSTPPEMIIGLIAGGDSALRHAIEGAEDDPQGGARALQQVACSRQDVVLGIASSGRTPYVIGGLEYAAQLGAKTVGLVCNENSELSRIADLTIALVVGPEIISGSTRLKAGTATKMVLNMITTGAMIRLGKTYGNLMVDLKATNRKLKQRSCRLVMKLTGLSEAQAQTLLEKCDGEVKSAVVAARRNVGAVEAREVLARAQGQLRLALELPTGFEHE